MAKKLSRREIENWLCDARKVLPDEVPAVKKYLTYHPEIKDYVEEKKIRGSPDAKNLEKRINAYSSESFRAANISQHTFTFSTEHKAAKIVGYLLAAAIAGFTVYLSYQVYKYGKYMADEVYERIYKEMNKPDK